MLGKLAGIPALLAHYAGCHNAKVKIGNLNLEQFREARLAAHA